MEMPGALYRFAKRKASHYIFNVEVRGGCDDTFYTERIGSAKLIYDDKVYFSAGQLGALAEHAIYVPSSTESTKEALMAAAQKRIDDYIGEIIVKITATDETVTGYYNSEIAAYDSELVTAQSELVQAQTLLNTEQAKNPSLWDWTIIQQCNLKIMECQQKIQIKIQIRIQIQIQTQIQMLIRIRNPMREILQHLRQVTVRTCSCGLDFTLWVVECCLA